MFYLIVWYFHSNEEGDCGDEVNELFDYYFWQSYWIIILGIIGCCCAPISQCTSFVALIMGLYWAYYSTYIYFDHKDTCYDEAYTYYALIFVFMIFNVFLFTCGACLLCVLGVGVAGGAMALVAGLLQKSAEKSR